MTFLMINFYKFVKDRGALDHCYFTNLMVHDGLKQRNHLNTSLRQRISDCGLKCGVEFQLFQLGYAKQRLTNQF